MNRRIDTDYRGSERLFAVGAPIKARSSARRKLSRKRDYFSLSKGDVTNVRCQTDGLAPPGIKVASQKQTDSTRAKNSVGIGNRTKATESVAL
jgi:hypothetical protein